MKRCATCGLKKPRDTFSRKTSNKDGLQSRCKLCEVAANAAHYERKRESVLACVARYRSQNRAKAAACVTAWALANPDSWREHRRIVSQRRRARKRGAECDQGVTVPALRTLHGDSCYICGNTLDFTAKRGTRLSAEIEHMTPLSRGGSHNFANTRLACHPCNAVKGARLTAEQVREMFE